MKLFFMRHGESRANERDILASRLDFPLSERGKEDVEAIAGDFKKKLGFLSGIISSPLVRARESAAPFCDLFGLTLETDEAMVEQDLGVYAGMTYSQIESASGYEHDRTKRWNWVPSGGGESYAMIADRLEPFFLRMEKRATAEPDGALLVVTHAVTMRLIRAYLEKTMPRYPREIAKNGEIWEADFSRAAGVYSLVVHLLGQAGYRNSKA